jgi:hypothetical protein
MLENILSRVGGGGGVAGLTETKANSAFKLSLTWSGGLSFADAQHEQFSGVQQLSMYTQNIQNCSAWPKAKIFGIARIDNPQVELKKSKVYHHCC